MQTHKMRAILTEFGGAETLACNSSLQDMLMFVENYTEFVGWSIWGAGLDPGPLYLNPANATSNTTVNILRDVVVPHMRKRSGAATSFDKRGVWLLRVWSTLR